MRARGLQAERLGLARRHPQHGGGAVGDLRRRCPPCGCRPPITGFSCGQPLERRVAQPLVAGDERASRRSAALLVEHRRLDRQDLALEAALVAGRGPCCCEASAKRVDVLARDAAVLGDALGGAELVGRRCPTASRRRKKPGPWIALAPRPTRLIASTPQAMPTSMAPAAIRAGDQVVGLLAEPHWQSTVVAPTLSRQAGVEPGDAR